MDKKEILPNLSELMNQEVDDSCIDKAALQKYCEQKDIPARTSPEWSNYLMTQFDKSELVEKDNSSFPKVHGLRRLAQIYVGDIVESMAHCISAPHILENGAVDFASFIYTIKFRRADNVYVVYSDAADCYYFNAQSNNADEAFARFPSAMAVTRAEARALRKALGLAVCSFEELAPNVKKHNAPLVNKQETYIDPDEHEPKNIDAGQINFISTKCMALNINVIKFINSKGQTYKKIKEVPYQQAREFCRILGDMIRAQANKTDYINQYCKDNNTELGTYNKDWDNQ